MRKKIITTLVFLAALGAGAAYFLYGRRRQAWPSEEESEDQEPLTFPSSEKGSSDKRVSIKNSAFTPSPFTVAPGTTVIWENEDSLVHQVGSGDFVSPPLSQGDTFSYTFFEPGVYDYFCPIHPFMKGVIIVE